MEKLIELLNEYQKELNDKEENKKNYEMYERELRSSKICMNDLNDPYEGLNLYGGYAKARLISKQFGFIKRLIDNDKIDNSKLSRESDMGFGDKYEREESLLMLLAISDNPIDLLCERLK